MCIIDGRLPEARESMSHALREDPGSSQALLGAMYLEMRRGNTEAALRMLKARRGVSGSGGQDGVGGGLAGKDDPAA